MSRSAPHPAQAPRSVAGGPAAPRRRAAPRLAAAALLGALFAALSLELGVRVLLFSDWADELAFTTELRQPRRLSHPSQDLYWILQSEFDAEQVQAVPGYHPRVGWLGGVVTPGDWRHVDTDSLGTRRPVLLYGDSYSACVVPRGSCFQDYLERSALGADFRLLNHGVGGYGLDQAALLLEATVDVHLARDPVVAVGIMVDDDLDRCGLAFRGWPKPRFEHAGAGWEVQQAAPEPPPRPLVLSYALRLLLHGGSFWPAALHEAVCPVEATERANKERCRAVLARLVAGLRARDVEAFFVLFFAPRSIDSPERNGWREPFLEQVLGELGMPWVSTRGPLLSNARESGRALDQYYLANGHLSPLGNQVALRAITEGLQGRFGAEVDTSWSPAELAGVLSADQVAAVVLGAPDSGARYEYGFREPFGRVEADRSRLCFHATGEQPTELHYELGGRVQAFEATARFIPMERLGPGEGSVHLSLVADGEVLLRTRLVRGDEPFEARVELAGRQRLVIAVDTAGDGSRGDWLVLSSPRFR